MIIFIISIIQFYKRQKFLIYSQSYQYSQNIDQTILLTSFILIKQYIENGDFYSYYYIKYIVT